MLRFLVAAALAGPILATGCSPASSVTPEERRKSADSDCRAVAEHGLRARPPSAGVQEDIYRECMQRKGYPNP
jgi:hypothetical protein